MYGDVNVTVEDGNLGRSTVTGKGVQFKIGVSNVETDSPILITGIMKAKEIKKKVGQTPLADACIDAVEWGANTIYCIPVKAGTKGTIETTMHTGSSSGILTVEGTPNNAYAVVIEIIDSGATNEGSFRYSTDGGSTYTEELTIPITGEMELPDTGLTVKFEDTADSGNISFVSGDTYTFTTTAPSMSNAAVIEAVESLINNYTAFEFVHIVGASSKPLWASLGELANNFLSLYKRPLFFVCEARAKQADENLEDYVAAMLEERKGINNMYLQVVCSHSRYKRMDGRTQDINNAGIITGLYCQAKESQSIGEVKSFPIPETKMLKLLPDGIEDHIKTLDASKFLTIRQYVSKEGYYVTSANMMSPDSSDFAYAEDIRVLNRLVRDVRAKAVDELQTEIDPNDLEASLANIQAQLNIPLEDAISDGIISSGTVAIDTDNLNILVDESLDIKVSYVPMGHARNMDITFAVENPYAES